ncbi:hypothetical protein G9A89_012553 [Geosiphon pyriformis]|nr:hypothetical protein G9A89_012553 [Geosiphon pyriformis]
MTEVTGIYNHTSLDSYKREPQWPEFNSSKIPFKSTFLQDPKPNKLLCFKNSLFSSIDSLNTPPLSPINENKSLPLKNNESVSTLLGTSGLGNPENSLPHVKPSNETQNLPFNTYQSSPIQQGSNSLRDKSQNFSISSSKREYPSGEKPQAKRKCRFTLASAPDEILEKIGLKKTKTNGLSVGWTPSPTDDSVNKELTMKNVKNDHPRKNPYPVRSPNKDSQGITFSFNSLEIFFHDPLQILRSNFEKPVSQKTSSPEVSSSESLEPLTRLRPRKKPVVKKEKIKIETFVTPRPQRRKGNSSTRVMADQFLFQYRMNSHPKDSSIRNDEPSLSHSRNLEFSQVLSELAGLILDNSGLELPPQIVWKGDPLTIQNLPHVELLHPNEVYVASTFRLTPVQYINAKHALLTASRRYRMRSLPFRKSDAQKLLRMDVNKASKLWAYFHQVGWL